MQGTEALQAYQRGEIDLAELAYCLGEDTTTALETARKFGFLPDIGPKPNKFHAIPVDADGFHFESSAEYRYYVILKVLQEHGKISQLKVHPRYVLQRAFKDNFGKKHRAIIHKPDFDFREDGRLIVTDVKGGDATQTAAWNIKYKWFCKKYPEIEYRIVEA